ncbi:hypothetical protein ACOMHN_046548 [Nucella lapillus]
MFFTGYVPRGGLTGRGYRLKKRGGLALSDLGRLDSFVLQAPSLNPVIRAGPNRCFLSAMIGVIIGKLLPCWWSALRGGSTNNGC